MHGLRLQLCVQDAWADVQVLLLLNAGLVIAGGLAKRVLVDRSSTAGPLEDLWNDIFDVSRAFLSPNSLICPEALARSIAFNKSSAKQHEWSDVLLLLSCRLSSRDMCFHLVLWLCTHVYKEAICGMSSS